MAHRREHRLVEELPLFGGILLGLLGLWWRGQALVLDGRVSGYHWPDWLFGAWNHAHGRHHMLDPFRQPLHSALVGALEGWTGLLDGALLLAGLSMVAVVMATGLSVRLAAGTWAGALAAAAIPWSPVATSGARWGNGYPLLTGAVAVGIAATLWATRRSSTWTLALAGTAAMVATMADDRGLLLLVVVLPVVAREALASWRGRGLVVVLLLGAFIGTRAAPWLGQSHSLTASDKRQVQTRVVSRWTTDSKDTAMVSACRPIAQETLLTPAFLATRCARQVIRHNVQQAIPGTSAWPLWLLGLGLFGFVSPRLRANDTAPLLAGGVLLATASTVAWTPLPARYQLVYTPLTGLLLPLAFGWRLPERLQPTVAVALLALTALADPHHHDRHPTKGIDARWLQPSDIAEMVRRRLSPEVPVRDCAGTYAELALLPDHTGPMGPELSIPDAEPCLHWLQGTPPRGMVVRPGRTLPGRHGTVDISEAVSQTEGWQRVASGAGVELWSRP